MAAVYRVVGAGAGGAAERQHIDARAHFAEARVVAPEHLEPRHQMVAESDRLRHLQVRERRHHAGGLALGDGDNPGLKPAYLGAHHARLAFQVKPQVGRDLVVARTPGVQFLAGFADGLDQTRLDVHVHIFKRFLPVKAAFLDFGAYRLQPARDGARLVGAQHAGALKGGGVRDGALDVLGVKPAVAVHRRRETLDAAVGGPAEAAPQCAGFSLLFAHGWRVSSVSSMMAALQTRISAPFRAP